MTPESDAATGGELDAELAALLDVETFDPPRSSASALC